MKLQRFTNNNKKVNKNQLSRAPSCTSLFLRNVAKPLRVVIRRDIFPRLTGWNWGLGIRLTINVEYIQEWNFGAFKSRDVTKCSGKNFRHVGRKLHMTSLHMNKTIKYKDGMHTGRRMAP